MLVNINYIRNKSYNIVHIFEVSSGNFLFLRYQIQIHTHTHTHTQCLRYNDYYQFQGGCFQNTTLSF
jgi:hypothetical protein